MSVKTPLLITRLCGISFVRNSRSRETLRPEALLAESRGRETFYEESREAETFRGESHAKETFFAESRKAETL